MLADGRIGQARYLKMPFGIGQKMPTKDNGDDSFQTVPQVKPIYGEEGTGVVE